MADQSASRGPGPRTARAPRRITAAYLRRAALHYLERYSVPAAQLRKVLARKIAVSCRHHGEEPSLHTALLDEVVAQCVALQLVDDRRFAEARAATLRRNGAVPTDRPGRGSLALKTLSIGMHSVRPLSAR